METVTADSYRRFLNENEVDQFAGNTIAYLDLIDDVSLNALMLGLGLEEVQYEPEEFPAIVYTLNDNKTTPTQVDYNATVQIFDNGLLVTADAPSNRRARDALVTVGEQIEEIDVFDITVSEKTIQDDPDEIPLPLNIINEWSF